MLVWRQNTTHTRKHCYVNVSLVLQFQKMYKHAIHTHISNGLEQMNKVLQHAALFFCSRIVQARSRIRYRPYWTIRSIARHLPLVFLTSQLCDGLRKSVIVCAEACSYDHAGSDS